MTDLTIGSPAPDFTLPRNGEGTVTLSGLRGKAVVLYFYPKDDTSGCTAEAIDFSALGGEFEAANTVVIGISLTASKATTSSLQNTRSASCSPPTRTGRLSKPTASGRKKHVWQKYMGVERTTFLIAPNGTIAEIWNKVKVAGHAQAVLDAAGKL